MTQDEIKKKIEEILIGFGVSVKPVQEDVKDWTLRYKNNGVIEETVRELSTLYTEMVEGELNKVEKEVMHKLLASINSFLAENGIKDTDGTPLSFSPERIQEWTTQN